MSDDQCEKHTTAIISMEKDMAVLRRDVEHVVGRICSHIEEAERTGGWRDKMTMLEADIKQIKSELSLKWVLMIGSGLISGMVVGGGIEFTKNIIGILK